MASTYEPNTLLCANPQHAKSAVRDEAVVLLIGRGEYYGLNAVGVRVWELLQGEQRFGELVDRIVAEYEVDHEQAARDLAVIVSDLRRHGLVHVNGPGAPDVDDP